LGSSKGKLLSYSNDNLIQLNTKGQRPIEVIEGNSKGDLLVFDDGFIRGLNRFNGKVYDLYNASLKAAVFINYREFFLGTNRGVVHFRWDGNNEFTSNIVSSLSSRVHVMAINPVNESLYVSTAEGLFVYNANRECKKIEWKNEALIQTEKFTRVQKRTVF
jgi:hypothetical protein